MGQELRSRGKAIQMENGSFMDCCQAVCFDWLRPLVANFVYVKDLAHLIVEYAMDGYARKTETAPECGVKLPISTEAFTNDLLGVRYAFYTPARVVDVRKGLGFLRGSATRAK